MTDATPDPVPGAPPPPPSSGEAASTEGLDPKVGGLLSYLLFGWIGGLIMFFTQKHPEVRFHAAQSILLSIAMFVVYIGLGIISSVLSFGLGSLGIWALFSLLYTVLGLAFFALWIFLCVKGYALDHFKLPFVGDMAEKWAAS